MKKALISMLVFCICIMPAMAVSIQVPKDSTTILLTIDKSVNSKEVVAGDVLDAKVSENVYVNKHLIFKEGTPAKVNVTLVKKATIMGVGGEIVIENGKVQDVNGNNHIIEFGKSFKGESKLYAKVFTGVGIIVWPCLFFGLAKGKQAIVPSNYEIPATLRSDFNFGL